MTLVEFSMYPLDQGVSLSKYVARCLEIIDASGLDYRTHAMGTILEGEFDQVMGVVKQCYERMSEDCDRVACYLKLDYRKGKSGRLESKVASVEQKAGRKFKR